MPTPLDTYQAERPRLFRAAYRMLGSTREAEDVLQEAWLRWQAAPHPDIAEPAGYLRRVVARLALDQLRSAHARRVEYVGPWLPEPILGDLPGADDPAARDEDLSTAFLLLLERLSPVERAVFVLRESLGFDYREIAGIVGKSEANCRQLERRARARLAAGKRFTHDPAEHRRLLDGFLRAVREGDVDGLVAILAEDVEAWGDGGGKVAAAGRVLTGRDEVMRLWLGLARKVPPGAEFRPVTANGLPAVLYLEDGRPRSLLQLATAGGRILAFHAVLNPDKLATLSRGDPPAPSSG